VTASRSTEELLARLAEDLEPVRPLAPLHRQVLGVAAIWAVSAALVAAWLGLHPLGVLERGGVSATFAWVLALVGFAGLTLGLACRIPGRERLALAAAGGVAVGVVVVLAVALVLPGSIAEAGPLAQCVDCVGRSLALAVPSGLLAMVLAVRGAPWRARAAGLGLAIGAISLGALLVHLSCPSPSPWHWLVAHALVPLAAGVPLGLLAAWVLHRLGLRSRLAASRLLDA
jgi:hypothetical protein